MITNCKMQDYAIMIPFLIVGFLCFTVTQGSVPSIGQVISEKCESNAGPMGRNIYRGVGMQFAMYCSDLPTEGRRPDFNQSGTLTQMYCPNLTNIKTCFKRAANFFRPCLKLEEQESVDIIHNMTSSYLDYLCDHEDLFNALLPYTRTCFTSSHDAIQNCFSQMFISHTSNVSSIEDPAAGLRARLAKPFILGVDDCLTLNQFQNCVNGALSTCENKTIAIMVNSMMSTVVDATPCKNVLEAQSSSAAELNLTASPVEQLEILIRKECKKNGDSTSSEAAINGLRSFSNCFTTLVNATQFKAEVIDAAASPSELDTLFQNYSRKVPVLNGCIKDAVELIQPCLTPGDRETINVISRVASSWLLNTFNNQGDRNSTHTGATFIRLG